MARGVDGREIFMDDHDKSMFMRTLMRLRDDSHFDLLAYCLMGNHFHLAIRVSTVPLSQVMQRILTSYVLAFNLRHNRTGHLFQARYRAMLCLNDSYLACLIRYIHQNPVRAGLVATADQWPWSSHEKRKDVAAFDIDKDFDPWRAPTPEMDATLLRKEIDRPTLDQIAQDFDHATLKSRSRLKEALEVKRNYAHRAFDAGYRRSDIACYLNVSVASIARYLSGSDTNVKPDTELATLKELELFGGL